MAGKTNLMAMGIPPFAANLIANGRELISAQGSSFGSANTIGPQNYFSVVNASNSGNYVALPAIGGDPGALLGDEFKVCNILSAAVVVCAPSTTTIYYGGASIAGNTGVSVSGGKIGVFYPVSASVWVGMTA